jgi:hypothetical protein
MAVEILAPITGAGNSNHVGVEPDDKKTLIMYAASGLTASEYGDIQISHDSGTTWQDLYADGLQVRLTDTDVAKTVYGPGLFRVAKEATTNAAGIYESSKGNL